MAEAYLDERCQKQEESKFAAGWTGSTISSTRKLGDKDVIVRDAWRRFVHLKDARSGASGVPNSSPMRAGARHFACRSAAAGRTDLFSKRALSRMARFDQHASGQIMLAGHEPRGVRDDACHMCFLVVRETLDHSCRWPSGSSCIVERLIATHPLEISLKANRSTNKHRPNIRNI